MQHESNNDSTKWTELLTEAVTKPGVISKAYRSFYGYSIGNQMLALLQCQIRYVEYKIKLQTTLPILHIL